MREKNGFVERKEYCLPTPYTGSQTETDRQCIRIIQISLFTSCF